MTTGYMYDDVTPSLIPADAEYIGYYVDGRYKDGTAVAKEFPHAHLVGIAAAYQDDADVLDVEPGDATEVDVYYWLKRQLARWAQTGRPIAAPAIYISASDVDSLMVHMDANGFVHGRDYVLWSAHYTGEPHLCGPDTCKECHTPCDATQYTNHADGKSLDESELGPSFLPPARPVSGEPTKPSPAPAPATMTLEIDGIKIPLTIGKAVTLTLAA